MESRHIKHPFPPVVDDNCTILILGSVPSIKSVEQNFYYGHPQNRFWKVLSALYGEDFVSKDKEDKRKLLLAHHVALYDSVEECDILGSSDAHISNVIPADIEGIIKGTKISKIFCNGATSLKYFEKYHKDLTATLLPSTSPANASWTLDKLIDSWKAILK